MLGISGGYKKGEISSYSSGLTFSKFETVRNDFVEQAEELVEFMSNYWKNRVNI